MKLKVLDFKHNFGDSDDDLISLLSCNKWIINKITEFKYTDTYWYLNNRNGQLLNIKNELLIYVR
jgi:hypothetical protein